MYQTTTRPVAVAAPKRISDKDLAKIGLTVSLAALVVTGLSKNPAIRKWHIPAAGAMVGFSAWHYTLYQPKNSKTPRGKRCERS